MKNYLLIAAAFVLGVILATQVAWSDDDKAVKAKVNAATARAAEEKYDLRYKFDAGETFRTKVVHLVTVETKIKGTTEVAKTRSISTKRWKIERVDEEGNITLAHSVESADMWQKMSGRAEVTYNSESDEKPPQEYEHVASSIGKPLATITIDPKGKILNRDKLQFNSGIGDLTVPLPDQPIKVGQEWHTPEEMIVRLPDKSVKHIKARQLFTLLKVETGVATISVKTEVITPVNDPQIQSQIVQRLQHGTIKFDLDAGRIRSKQMDLDETVIGFSGAQSVMQYLARLTEEPVDETAGKSSRKQR